MRDHIPEDRIVARIDSLLRMVGGVRSGMGVGLLLCILANDQPNLVPLGEPLDEAETDVWILTHAALKSVARVKALSAFLYDRWCANDKLLRVSSD